MCIAGLQSSYTLILIRSISIIYLYLKIHNQTGYKYLGKTIADPHKYEGSGKLWKRHINKHGYDVKTKILFQTEDKEEFKKNGINVVFQNYEHSPYKQLWGEFIPFLSVVDLLMNCGKDSLDIILESPKPDLS